MALKLSCPINYEICKGSYEITKVVNAALEFNNELSKKIIKILFDDIINQYCQYFTEKQLLTLNMAFAEYILNIFKSINEYIEDFTKLTRTHQSIDTTFREFLMEQIHNWIIQNVINNRTFEICF